jgi:hemerythrin-like domain-containing protein
MKAVDVLMAEHRVIEQVLDTLEASTKLLENGVAIRPEFFLTAADFIRGYTDGCHYAKEEGILFTHMEKQGIPLQGCPLGVMLAEHECGRQYTRAFISAAKAIQAGEAGGIQRIIQSSRSYVALLRQHIFKEDNILFPLAEEVIPTDQHALILEAFDPIKHAEVGQGVQEKYLDLAQRLKSEINSYY